MATIMPPPSHLPNLPPEIILYIIDSLIPTDKTPIALPASDPITKTLLLLTRTSKLTHSTALRLLYGFCLYIDSYKRLSGVLYALQMHKSRQKRYPFRAEGFLVETSLCIPLHEHITSLYLIPAEGQYTSNVSHMRDVCKLLDIVAPRLKRLLLLFPIYCDWRPELIKQRMITTLSKLTSLEVFGILKNDLGMNEVRRILTPSQEMVWVHWPKLRVLALHRTYPTPEDWKLWREMPQLERLVLSDYRHTGRLLREMDALNLVMKRERPFEVVLLSRPGMALGEKLKNSGMVCFNEAIIEGSNVGPKNSLELFAHTVLATGEEMGAAWVAEQNKISKL